ncbi:hypothetical protein C0J52_17108, partial [Blattella germanica]
ACTTCVLVAALISLTGGCHYSIAYLVEKPPIDFVELDVDNSLIVTLIYFSLLIKTLRRLFLTASSLSICNTKQCSN